MQTLKPMLISSFLAFALATNVQAESVRVPTSANAQLPAGDSKWDTPIPQRGIQKAQVEARFGSPVSKNGPTGQPPIYYWEYDAFTVYFEGDFVIHTVRKYKQP